MKALWLAMPAICLAGALNAQPPAAPDPAVPSPAKADDGRPVSWGRMLPNLASDQKRIWTFPVHVARGRHFWPVVAVASTTALLIATDGRSGPSFRNTTAFHGFNSAFSSNVTTVGIIAAPVSLYVAGLFTRNAHAQNTALLAGEAVGGAEILTFVMKDIDSRKRPSAFNSQGTYGDSWFEGRNGWIHSTGSFPSGHTIAAFAVATVISRRYPHHRWVPFVAYGLAGAVGFSRMTLSAHFPSDVFAGAALGYSISRFAVLR
jgi:membrane-associated phospholipid phosphatase